MTLRRTWPLAVAVIALTLSGCAGAAPEEPDAPSDTASATPSETSTPEPSETPSDDADSDDDADEGSDDAPVALPDCTTIYSAALTAQLTGEGRVAEGDTSVSGGGGWGSGDAVVVGVIQSAAERVSCTWVLPASESGSTTSVVRIDAGTASSLDAHLTGVAGFTASSAAGGTLYTLEVGGDFPFSEAHLITGDLLIVTEAYGTDAEALTLDAAAQLTAP